MEINPLLIIIQYRSLPQFTEYVKLLDRIDKLWFKYFSQIVAYDLARIEFLKRTEYTHFLLLTDDCLIKQEDIDLLLEDAKDGNYDVISGWFNQDLTDHKHDSNISTYTLPPEPSPTHKYEEFNFNTIDCIYERLHRSPENPIIPVFHQGTALTLLTRKVIEGVPFRNWNGICQDACLSIDLAKKGIKQYVDLRCRVLHLKISDWMQWRISEVGKKQAEMKFQPKGTHEINGSLMYLDDKDSLKLRDNGFYEYHETELIKKIVKPNDVCFDIGANIGYFSLLMSPLCQRVYSYEPEPYNYALLNRNVELNHTNNILTYDYAVTNYSSHADYDTIPLYFCPHDSGMHRVYRSKYCNDLAVQVQSIRLDDVPLSGPNFIKMDIEGSEYGALKGMEKLLTNNHPKMIIEFHPPSIEEYGAKPKEEYDFLKSLGYDIRLIPNINRSISYEDLEKETRNTAGRNLYCTHPNRS